MNNGRMMRRSPSDAESYDRYLELVPKEMRDQIADRVLEKKIRSQEDVSALTQEMLAEEIRGNLPPQIGSAVREYLDLLMRQMALGTAKAESEKGNSLLEVLAKGVQEADARRRALLESPPEVKILDIVVMEPR